MVIFAVRISPTPHSRGRLVAVLTSVTPTFTAILTQGAFTEADFHNADLSDALMDRADFVGTDLRNANLSGVIAWAAAS